MTGIKDNYYALFLAIVSPEFISPEEAFAIYYGRLTLGETYARRGRPTGSVNRVVIENGRQKTCG